MTGTRLGTIDLGTNTFHLLIIEKGADGTFEVLFKERQFVHLGEGGVGHLNEGSMQRGWATLNHFVRKLREFKVDRYRVVGTAALREADNASVFIEKAQELGVNIEVIDGMEEARLIHRGVQMAAGDLPGRQLIMDIGGGSVEFILSSAGQIEYAASLRLGVAILYGITKGEDPLSPGTIGKVRGYIREQLQELGEILRKRPPAYLIGASGSFEVLEGFEPGKDAVHLCSVLSIENFEVLLEEILPSSVEERLAMPAIPASRARLIVVAFLLIREVLDLCDYDLWLFSPYALKEGILAGLD